METAPLQRNLYHYFFGCTPGKRILLQEEDTLNLSFHASGKIFKIKFDQRQRGILVAFDGTLLWGSLPKRQNALLYHEKLFDLTVPIGQLRGARPEEETPQYRIVYHRERQVATIPIYRSVILAPFNFRMVARRYNERSMNPKYLVVTTDDKSASWLTTSW